MSKTETNLPSGTVAEIKTTVSYNGESLESVIRFNVSDLANLVQTQGGEAANKSLKTLTDQIYAKTNDNLKQLINK